MFRAVLLLVTATVCMADQPSCGKACQVNTDCGSDGAEGTCGLCIETKSKGKVCASPCAGACKTADQCGDANCGKCDGSKCVSHFEHPCGGACVEYADCDQKGNCSSCIESKCGATCNQLCTDDANCLEATCPQCNKVTHTCMKAAVGCGKPCVGASDCDQTTGCSLCVNNTRTHSLQCGAGCGSACTSDSQCADANCPTCKDGKCGGSAPPPAPSGGCNSLCTASSQCTGNSSCPYCNPIRKTCGAPPLQCGAKCSTSADCNQTDATCKTCVFHKQTNTTLCGSGCGMTCDADSDCEDANCPKCNSGKCSGGGPAPGPPSPPGAKCGGACKADSDCAGGTDGCTSCPSLLSVCHKPPQACGGACEYDVDCGAGGCSTCTNKKCAK